MQRFHGVATKYLDSYLGWFRAIDQTTNGLLNPALLLAQGAGNDLVLIYLMYQGTCWTSLVTY